MVVPKNIKQNYHIHGSAIPLLGMHPQEQKRDLKGYLHTRVHGRVICRSEEVEATPGPVDRWMDKQNALYIQIKRNICSAVRKKSCQMLQHGWTLLSETSWSQRKDKLSDFMYTRHPEKSDSQMQKGGWGLPRPVQQGEERAVTV